MSEANSTQVVYATNLRQSHGYPLFIPTPRAGLGEPYEKEGLQIGDVGYVDYRGEFVPHLNIGFHLLDDHPPSEPIRWQEPYKDQAALDDGQLLFTGVERQTRGSRVTYEFTATSNVGAILILPTGATLYELRDPQELEKFRKVAVQHAAAWCKHFKCDSLYLVTGVYKTRSWTLGSFDRGERSKEILVEPRGEKQDIGTYKWTCGFQVDHRSGPKHNKYENQTVLIRGFKMMVRRVAPGMQFTDVLPVTESRNVILSFVNFLLMRLASLVFARPPERPPRTATVEHSPTLSQPLNPSDLINRYLLDKNPDAQVAITHDNEWIDILEKERLSYSDLMQDGPLREFLAKRYVCRSDNGAIYLESQMRVFSCLCLVSSLGRIDTEDAHSTRHKSESSQPQPATENAHIVITHIRAENVTVALWRIPIGFYVQLEFNNGTSGRTKIKPVPVCDPVIQWEDLIQLPSDPSATVRLTLCASFEFSAMLGKGELLGTEELSVGNLLNRTNPITFTNMEGKIPLPCCSLLVAVQQWHCNHRTRTSSQVDGSLYWEDSSELAKVTDEGHDALRRYRRDHREEDLDLSITHFERALDLCHDAHPCRAAALFNLATVTSISYQSDGTQCSFDRAIALYRDALELRRVGHPDRPTRMLHLCQALLHHYGATGYEGKLQELIDEIKDICPEGKHERRAADLILQTYERFRLCESDDLAELNELISKLDVAAREPPETYFDRPIRFNNLGLALLRRFHLRRDPSDLELAVTWLEKTVQITPNDHLNKPSYLGDLGNALLDRFQQLKNIVDVDRAIVSFEDAVRLTPHGHRDMPGYRTNLCVAYLTRFQCLKDVSDLDQGKKEFQDATRLASDQRA